MKYATKAGVRSEHLKTIIQALNTWAQSPGKATGDALKEALNTYGHAVKDKTYEPIAWECVYPRNTLSKPNKPSDSFDSIFGEQESAPIAVRGESPSINTSEEKAPWEE